MTLRKISLLALALALPALMIPSAAKADGLVFHFSNPKLGCISIGMGIGTGTLATMGGNRVPTLTSIGTTNTGSHFSGKLGTVSFSTGTALSTSSTAGRITQVIYSPGGSISVVSSTGIGSIPAGTTLFTGLFSSNVTFAATNPNAKFGPWTLNGKIKTTSANSALLALLGLPAQTSGSLTALALDISFNLTGACVTGGDIILTSVPEPGTLLLFGSGMLSMAGMLRRRLKT